MYKAVDPGAVDGGAFVLWCLETLAAHGATLTPLARLERRVPTLYVKNEEEKGGQQAGKGPALSSNPEIFGHV